MLVLRDLGIACGLQRDSTTIRQLHMGLHRPYLPRDHEWVYRWALPGSCRDLVRIALLEMSGQLYPVYDCTYEPVAGTLSPPIGNYSEPPRRPLVEMRM